MLSITLLVIIAWLALSGSIDQFSRAYTFGQIVQTYIQAFCGILSLAIILTFFIDKKRAKLIHHTWLVSLVLTASISALVWGPPMPIIALVFGIAAFLLAKGILWLMNTSSLRESG